MPGRYINHGWLNTSVEDLRSTLECLYANGQLHMHSGLEATADEASRRGHRTRERLLRSLIRRIDADFRAHHGRPDVRAQR